MVGFNRYMVECKSEELFEVFFEDLVLIDTWWNVNVQTIERLRTKTEVLIDTWWNVNTDEEKIKFF